MSNVAGQTRDETQPIQCPACSSAMEPVAFGGITVDRCVKCRGIWFDAREHEKLKEVKGAEAIDESSPAAATPPTAGKRMCPVCHTQMIEMTDVRQRHLKFESCTVCYGAFFDAGEFKDYKELTVVESIRSMFRK